MNKLTLNPTLLKNMSVKEAQELVQVFAKKNNIIDKTQIELEFEYPAKSQKSTENKQSSPPPPS